MNFLALLIGFPVIAGFAIVFVKPYRFVAVLTRISAGIVIALSLLFAAAYWGGAEIFLADSVLKSWAVAGVEIAIALFVIISGYKARNYFVCVLALVQAAVIMAYEYTGGHSVPVEATFIVDRLAVFMVLIVGIVGSLICIFAVKYMKDYHEHYKDIPDRRSRFFGMLFIFTGVMFGLVLANEMVMMLLFWEITTLASFLLIGYSKTKEATRNAFLALTVNIAGGLIFTAAIVIAGIKLNVSGFQGLIATGGASKAAVAAAFLLACAGLTKSAQMPFSRWLLGAMVAPTPVSAILHSSTMVKAGVYLIIRIAPLLGLNAAGISITLIGAVTFLVTAMMAISMMDAKKVLAYSTISNLGLIVACAAINTPESIWAAMMLILFHAVTKSLLFLTVGATENRIGSRNVESMDGLFKASPALATLMIIGIAGMFIAPFGMLISKWAAIKAFVDYGNPFVSTLVLLIIAFGSAVTFFFWTKWLGKLMAETNLYAPKENAYKMGADEKISLYAQAAMVLLICAAFPLISKYFIVPFVSGAYMAAVSPLSGTDSAVILAIMLTLFMLVMLAIPLYRRYKGVRGSVYMAGENMGDNVTYRGSIGETITVQLRNWYLTDIFGEKIWFRKTQFGTSVLLIVAFFVVAGGLL